MDIQRGKGNGRVVVITGGTSGVGRATAVRFATDGCKVGLLARGPDGLEAAAKDVEAHGGVAHPVQTDVADPEQVEAAAEAVEGRFGPVDVWINNAMTSVFSPFDRMRADEFRRVTEVTYLGAVHGTMSALQRMKPRGHGVIVQVGSALAFRSIPLQSAYCGAKHALHGFTESLRTELLHDRSNIRVVEVHMPALNTPQFDRCLSRMPRKSQPVPPIYQPEVAAEAITWAADHCRREVWVGATTTATILASRLAPGILDHYLARTGYGSQQTDGPAEESPGNLWSPLTGDPGAHGRFDERAHSRSLQFGMARHRGSVLIGIAAATAAGLTARRR